jgi:membrane-bound ClpP family serine protease
VDWKVRSIDGAPIEKGAKVEVVKMESIILIVKKL